MAIAAPVSYCALRFGAAFFANANFETAKPSTCAFFAQLALNSTSGCNAFVKFSASLRVATINAHGCSLLLDGAQRAASKRLRKSAAAIGFSENALGLQRSRINSCTGNSVGAGFFMMRSPGPTEILWSKTRNFASGAGTGKNRAKLPRFPDQPKSAGRAN